MPGQNAFSIMALGSHIDLELIEAIKKLETITMNALVIIAHGSSHAEANKEIAVLTENVRQKAKDKFAVVEYAFLEMANPGPATILERLVNNNVTEVTILPYFLSSGKHVTRDIPELLSVAREKHPDCAFKLSSPIGNYDGMAALILDAVNYA